MISHYMVQKSLQNLYGESAGSTHWSQSMGTSDQYEYGPYGHLYLQSPDWM